MHKFGLRERRFEYAPAASESMAAAAAI